VLTWHLWIKTTVWTLTIAVNYKKKWSERWSEGIRRNDQDCWNQLWSVLNFFRESPFAGLPAQLALNIEDIHRKFEKRKLYRWTFGPNFKKKGNFIKDFSFIITSRYSDKYICAAKIWYKVESSRIFRINLWIYSNIGHFWMFECLIWKGRRKNHKFLEQIRYGVRCCTSLFTGHCLA